jgi:hypothetical protein
MVEGRPLFSIKSGTGAPALLPEKEYRRKLKER